VPRSSARRSPLAMLILGLLVEGPMHAYRMQQLIVERGKDNVVNVAQRNSIYQTLARLLRDRLVRVHRAAGDERRPERIVYRITAEGSRTFHAWLESVLAEPAREFPQFPAGLSLLMVLSPATALRCLEARARTLETQLAAQRAATEGARAAGLPRLFLLDDEYREAMVAAELAWIAGLIADLRSKSITWSLEWLRKIASDFRG